MVDGTYHFVYRMQIEEAWWSTEVILWDGYDAYRWVEYANPVDGFFTK
jgi:hypothetical protein